MSYRYCCEDISKVEGYDKWMTDTTQVYVVHHRLETHTSDGEKRLVDLTREELLALGMYYDRPPEELIFLSRSEHFKLHVPGFTRTKKHWKYVDGKRFYY